MKRILIYTLPVLLVLITPFIWSDNLYNGLITAKQIWFYLAMALLILVSAVDLLFQNKTVSFSFNIIDLSLLTFFVYFLIRTIFTPYTPIIYNTKFLNYSLLLIFYFIVKFSNPNAALNKYISSSLSGNEPEKAITITYSEILIFILILTGLVEAVWGLLQLYEITRSFHTGFKITGTFFNPAPYALYLAAIFPLALGNLIEIKELNRIYKLTYFISLLTVILIILVLPATMNRASWLGVAAGSLFVFYYRYDLLNRAIAFLNNSTRKLIAITFILLVTGLSGAGLYLLKKGSSEGRLLIWEVTLGKIAEKPLFGHGVGRFEAEYNNWQADYFKSQPSEMEGPKGMAAGNTKYCFNEYLEFGSETGIVGVLLFLGFIGSTIYIGFRKLKSKETQFSGYYLYLLSAFISMIVMALVSFLFYSLPTLIFFFFLTALISSCVTTSVFNLFIPHRFLLLIVLVPFSVVLLIFSRQQFKTYNTFDEAVKLYQVGLYSESCKSFSEIYNPLQYKGYYLQYYGKALTMNNEYQTGLLIMSRAEHFTSDEILFTSLGDTYKLLNRFTDAEQAYLYASFMVPHKLYPLYLLATLYYETGQREEAVITAVRILNKKIKVESEATEEIRIKMNSIIEKWKQ